MGILCDICGYSFETDLLLDVHVTSLFHHYVLEDVGITRHVCAICEFDCDSIREYAQHVDEDAHIDRIEVCMSRRDITVWLNQRMSYELRKRSVSQLNNSQVNTSKIKKPNAHKKNIQSSTIQAVTKVTTPNSTLKVQCYVPPLKSKIYKSSEATPITTTVRTNLVPRANVSSSKVKVSAAKVPTIQRATSLKTVQQSIKKSWERPISAAAIQRKQNELRQKSRLNKSRLVDPNETKRQLVVPLIGSSSSTDASSSMLPSINEASEADQQTSVLCQFTEATSSNKLATITSSLNKEPIAHAQLLEMPAIVPPIPTSNFSYPVNLPRIRLPGLSNPLHDQDGFTVPPIRNQNIDIIAQSMNVPILPSPMSTSIQEESFTENSSVQPRAVNVKQEPDLLVLIESGPHLQRIALGELALEEAKLAEELQDLAKRIELKDQELYVHDQHMMKLILKDGGYTLEERLNIGDCAIKERFAREEFKSIDKQYKEKLNYMQELIRKKAELVAACNATKT